MKKREEREETERDWEKDREREEGKKEGRTNKQIKKNQCKEYPAFSYEWLLGQLKSRVFSCTIKKKH